jgi:16S rRNA (adenine1518-N6/adenine1519-N6)-dimethyltransferase
MESGDFQIEDPRAVLKRYGLKPKRSWGQNFLISRRALQIIAETCVDKPGRRVVEIGAGVGTLTKALLQVGAKVTAVERDRDMCAVLRSELAGVQGFELRDADALKFDYAACFSDEPGVVAGNLPYQLTGPLLARIIEVGSLLVRSVIMVQEEVANRIVATHSEKARGALSVIIQSRFDARMALKLGPTAFHPRPKVSSAVVVLEPLKHGLFEEESTQAVFEKVVKAAFTTRRKTLRNALAGKIGSVNEVVEILEQAEVDPRLRPERLSLEKFAVIARLVEKKSSSLAPLRP